MSAPNIAPEVVERLIRLCRGLAICTPSEGNAVDQILVDFAKDIIAELPAPVDPDLLEARKAFVMLGSPVWTDIDIEDGRADYTPMMRMFLKGIKRGRELERGK